MDEARIALTRTLPSTNLLPQLQQPITMSQGNVTFDSSGNMVNTALGTKSRTMADLEAEKERKRKEDADKVRQTAKPLDKSRPISSTPISGTPWCVVWTGDSRVFFYNPSTRTSVWEKPEDLVGKSRYLENLNEYY